MLKLIIVGSGQVVSSTHLPNLQKLKDEVEVVGLADVQVEKASQLAAQYDIPNVSTSVEELVRKLKPDAALVSVPNRFHAQTSIELLRMGVHVLCEKPPAMNATEAAEMERAAAENGKLLSYGLHFRHTPEARHIDKRVRQGDFGKLYHIDARWLRRRGIPGWGSFTRREIQGGGPLIDIGVHILDLALSFLDYPKPTAVLANMSDLIGKKGGTGDFGAWDGSTFTIEDGFFGFITFEGGASIALSTSFALNMEEKDERQITLYGETLGAKLYPLRFFGEAQAPETPPAFGAADLEEPHLKLVRNFLRTVDGREELLVTAAQGTRLQGLVDALYQSARAGNVISL